MKSAGTRSLNIQGFTADESNTGAFASPNGTPVTVRPGDVREYMIEFLPLSVGPISSAVVLRSDDRETPLARVTLLGEGVELDPCLYEVSPNDLDFGSVETFREKHAPISITNTGNYDCLVHGFELSGRDLELFALASAPTGEVMLRPGESVTTRIDYRPTTAGPHSAGLSFYISSPTDSNPTTSVGGAGVYDAPIIYPDTVDFGNVALGCTSETRHVRISNDRDTRMVLTSAELAPGSSDDFTLAPFTFPLNLAPHSYTELSIAYQPSGNGPDSATLRITEQNVARAYMVWISGAGDLPGTVEEHATQVADDKVDVLFVADASGTVGEEEALIGNNFSSFIAVADELAIDYQLAVIDMTHEGPGFNLPCIRQLDLPQNYIPGWCGYFAQTQEGAGSRIITGDEQPNPDAAFSALINIGSNGAGWEQAFESARAALRGPRRARNEPERRGGVDLRRDAQPRALLAVRHP